MADLWSGKFDHVTFKAYGTDRHSIPCLNPTHLLNALTKTASSDQKEMQFIKKIMLLNSFNQMWNLLCLNSQILEKVLKDLKIRDKVKCLAIVEEYKNLILGLDPNSIRMERVLIKFSEHMPKSDTGEYILRIQKNFVEEGDFVRAGDKLLNVEVFYVDASRCANINLNENFTFYAHTDALVREISYRERENWLFTKPWLLSLFNYNPAHSCYRSTLYDHLPELSQQDPLFFKVLPYRPSELVHLWSLNGHSLTHMGLKSLLQNSYFWSNVMKPLEYKYGVQVYQHFFPTSYISLHRSRIPNCINALNSEHRASLQTYRMYTLSDLSENIQKAPILDFRLNTPFVILEGNQDIKFEHYSLVEHNNFLPLWRTLHLTGVEELGNMEYIEWILPALKQMEHQLEMRYGILALHLFIKYKTNTGIYEPSLLKHFKTIKKDYQLLLLTVCSMWRLYSKDLYCLQLKEDDGNNMSDASTRTNFGKTQSHFIIDHAMRVDKEAVMVSNAHGKSLDILTLF